MMETENNGGGLSLLERGRELLERGDIDAALAHYSRALDPDSLDEEEARNMLIEARASVTRKHFPEALECFEEAVVMGTDVQRKQALEGLAGIGEMKSRLRLLTAELKKGLRKLLGKKIPVSKGLALISDDENTVLISERALEKLPPNLAKSNRIQRLAPHLLGLSLPIQTAKCIPYADEEDVQFILTIAEHLAAKRENGAEE
jgi:tetratricopeptide (TPR) repeat protein